MQLERASAPRSTGTRIAKTSHGDPSSTRGSRIWKRAPALGALEYVNRAAEGTHVVAHQRQAEAGAARHAPVVGRASAKEPLEDLLALLSGNARTGVVDVDRELASLVVAVARAAASAGVVVGVVDQVGHHAFEAASVHAR